MAAIVLAILLLCPTCHSLVCAYADKGNFREEDGNPPRGYTPICHGSTRQTPSIPFL